MSCHSMVWALRQKGLNASERVVLIYLADKANEAMTCWPSLKRISDDTEISVRTIHSAVHKLQVLGFIRIEKRAHQHHYELMCPPKSDATPPEPEESPKPIHQPTVEEQNQTTQPTLVADFASPIDLAKSADRQNLQLDLQNLHVLEPKPQNSVVIELAKFATKSPKEESKGESKKDTGLRPDAGASAPADVRSDLWKTGLSDLRHLTGLPTARARSLLGKLCKTARDDCARVRSVLTEAMDMRPVDPVSWLTKAVAYERPQNAWLAILDRDYGDGITIDGSAGDGEDYMNKLIGRG